MRLKLTIEEQAARIGDLEAAAADADELREKNTFLQTELRGRDGTLAENEEQLEEMEVRRAQHTSLSLKTNSFSPHSPNPRSQLPSTRVSMCDADASSPASPQLM